MIITILEWGYNFFDYIYRYACLIITTLILLQGIALCNNHQDMIILISFPTQKLKNLIDHKSVLILTLPVNTLSCTQ